MHGSILWEFLLACHSGDHTTVLHNFKPVKGISLDNFGADCIIVYQLKSNCSSVCFGYPNNLFPSYPIFDSNHTHTTPIQTTQGFTIDEVRVGAPDKDLIAMVEGRCVESQAGHVGVAENCQLSDTRAFNIENVQQRISSAQDV